jgi:mycofactocin precursor
MSEPTTPAVVETEPEQETEATSQADTEATAASLVQEEVLVEDVSIDGMCGVY